MRSMKRSAICAGRAPTPCATSPESFRGQQLKALLLRLGYHYTGKSSWTEAHLRYLRELEMAHPAQKVVLEEYLIAISQAGERIGGLPARSSSMWPAGE